jgi:hypothetical protein
LTEPTKRRVYLAYNRAVMTVDDGSWQILKKKALSHYRDHRRGQEKQGFFNQLNEAFAYQYLVRKGFEKIRLIEEGTKKSPDITFSYRQTRAYCEVKTLNISDEEIGRRSGRSVCDGRGYVDLSMGFLGKLRTAVNAAKQQIESVHSAGLTYLIILFDDVALDYYGNYRKQLIAFCQNEGLDDLFIRTGLLGNRRISIKGGLMTRLEAKERRRRVFTTCSPHRNPGSGIRPERI